MLLVPLSNQQSQPATPIGILIPSYPVVNLLNLWKNLAKHSSDHHFPPQNASVISLSLFFELIGDPSVKKPCEIYSKHTFVGLFTILFFLRPLLNYSTSHYSYSIFIFYSNNLHTRFVVLLEFKPRDLSAWKVLCTWWLSNQYLFM